MSRIPGTVRTPPARKVLAEFLDEAAAQGGAVVLTGRREAITETHAGGVHVIGDGRVRPYGGPRAGPRRPSRS
ncbi:hypothetical protein [Streptomyces sp. NRRL S-340]|uniref:hypothetical protein n=1 Tax=Streptomyces sp. NRRL S-340 TaxID=1463901 RepID=UPI0018FE50F3|nr:hypothetical protein [Streptomyces sp. NRRL S-340]